MKFIKTDNSIRLSLAFRRCDRAQIIQLINDDSDVNIILQNGSTPLLEAMKVHDHEMVDRLIKHGANPHMEDEEGLTPLFWAVLLKDKDLFCTLIKHGAKVNPDKDKYILLEAIKRYSPEIFTDLLKMDVDIHVKNDNGYNVLHEAAERGNQDAVKLILQKNKEGVDETNTDGFTALHLAFKREMYFPVTKQDTTMMELLIENGADINKKDGNGNTLLCIAIEKQNQKMVAWLLQHGAKLDVEGKHGLTPLSLAVKKGDTVMVDLLINNEANVNGKEKAGHTPLCIAIENSDEDMINCLIGHEARVDVKGVADCSPLSVAIKKRDSKMVDLLIKHGADVNEKEKDGHTPLCIAVEMFDKDMVKCLIKHKANMEVKGKQGLTPLCLAAHNFDVEMSRLLKSKGAKLSPDECLAPLSVAFEHFYSLIKYLINFLCLADKKEDKEAIGKTYLHFKEKHEKINGLLTNEKEKLTSEREENLQLIDKKIREMASLEEINQESEEATVQGNEGNSYWSNGNKNILYSSQSESNKANESQDQRDLKVSLKG